MSDRVALVVCRDAGIYDHGPQHPLRPERVLFTWDLIEACGLDRLPNVTVESCRPATDEELLLVHTSEYIDAARRAGHGEDGPWGRFGFGPGDNPIFADMHEASALATGASIVAAQEVWEGRAEHSFNAAGGLHHAMPARASGFCVYDDPAVAIRWLLENGAERVAYVDVDVHHGDGPQAIFYDDPRVLTISLHEFGPWFFPGTGDVPEIGTGGAEGMSVNVPLPSGTTDEGWLRAFRAIVPPLVKAFAPDVLFTQLGCDTHATDPLATLSLSTAAYRETAKELHTLAHDAAGGRWVATGGGGYQWASVVPRAWTIYFAEQCGAVLDDDIPAKWLEEVEPYGPVPATFSDPSGATPSEADEHVGDVIGRVRKAVFGFHGI